MQKIIRIRQLLARLFSSVYNVEPDGEFGSLDILSTRLLAKMPEFIITKESVHSKLCNLNISKSLGPDMLHPRVFS